MFDLSRDSQAHKYHCLIFSFALLQGTRHGPLPIKPQTKCHDSRQGNVNFSSRCHINEKIYFGAWRISSRLYSSCRIFHIASSCQTKTSHNFISTTMKTRTLASWIIFLGVCLFSYTAGDLHPRKCTLWDGGNEEKCSTHPHSCHAGDGNQPPQPISRANPQTDRRGDAGESMRRPFQQVWDNFLAANLNEQL